MTSKLNWIDQSIPKGYTANELNGSGGIPFWENCGNLSYSVKRHYRGVPYRLYMRGIPKNGYRLEFHYWWDNQWVHHDEPFTSDTFPQVINSLFDRLIGVKKRFIWS